MPVNPPLNRKLRMGVVGGGFIGRVHVLAATLDNRAVLAAGALSSAPVRSRSLAPDFDIPPERAYGSYQEMLATEARLPPSERIDFVSIATPNDTHFDIARAFIEGGFNVLCDKPMTLDLEQAEELAEIVERAGVVFAVTHNYTGYPLVRQGRDMVRGGELGEIHAIRVCYLQGSLYRQRAPEQQRRFAWKTDPARAGISGCFGDIGIHAYNLLRFITGLEPAQVSCHLRIFYPEGRLDDYGTAVLRFANGALGTVTASRVSHGRENDLWIEIDGANGSLEWHQEEPNKMWLRVNGQPHRLYTRDPASLLTTSAARLSCRLPAGDPEGFLEAFANIYTAVYADVIGRAAGERWDASPSLYPTVVDGIDGVRFVAQCVASSQVMGAWMPLSLPCDK
ncbi:MAG TPA: Gfo/Idh/MocA family oxidoreductase [Gemmataceae bacterium]|nr:Gfo/Idh/MocA family oxidoreductase [Gemmataceae bacterium]